MQVLKFGGTSVANAENIDKVVKIVCDALKRDRSIVVSSAISGCTDKLIETGNTAARRDETYKNIIMELEERHLEIIRKIIPSEEREATASKISDLFSELRGVADGIFLVGEMSGNSYNRIVSFGELLSTTILEARFRTLGIQCRWVDSRKIIRTAKSHPSCQADLETTYGNIRRYLEGNDSKLYIFPGFIASDEEGKTTTLGRGGSDYTAALIAVGSDSRRLEIWTDVSGMKTADPRIVPDARTIDNISYKEALELSHFGAKVVYPPTIQPVVKRGIPIYIKNTFEPEHPGTLIEGNPPESNDVIKGISSSDRIALISMEGSGMVGIPGYSGRLFETLAREEINIILITQASSVHTMCVAIDEKDAAKAKRAVDETFAYEISLGKVDPLKVEYGFSILSVVGNDMKNQSGAGSRMFDALGSRGINIRAIAQGSSEKNISAVVETKEIKAAIRVVHEAFFGNNREKLNLFIAGKGNVGSAFLKLVKERKEYIRQKTGKELIICGIADSKGYRICREGISPESIGEYSGDWNTAAENHRETFTESICRSGIKNSIFVDCTSSREIAYSYAELFRNGISVVTCNKIAGSSHLPAYRNMRKAATENGCGFGYETTVGASLPIISTIRQMINSGDEIESFEAVLSGTMNYIFDNYCAEEDFASTVRKARELGYSEPDPRGDLSGTDVLRKSVILARECGYDIETDDIEFTPVLGKEYFEGDTETFFSTLEKNEDYFKKLYTDAKEKGCRLKFAVKFERGKVSAGLVEVRKGHPFYNLEGTNNCIVLKSTFYPEHIRIEGAGAGAVQTALGLLNDTLTIK